MLPDTGYRLPVSKMLFYDILMLQMLRFLASQKIQKAKSHCVFMLPKMAARNLQQKYPLKLSKLLEKLSGKKKKKVVNYNHVYMYIF